MKPLEVLYQSIKDRVTFNYDQFENSLKDWKSVGLYEQNELIGCVIQKDNELHIGYAKQPKAMRKHLKETLKVVLDSYGHVITYVLENNPKGLNYCKRLGFYEISKEQGKIKLRCDRCKYV